MNGTGKSWCVGSKRVEAACTLAHALLGMLPNNFLTEVDCNSEDAAVKLSSMTQARDVGEGEFDQ
jgi:hypothetical protein